LIAGHRQDPHGNLVRLEQHRMRSPLWLSARRFTGSQPILQFQCLPL
jgi:hypothetical protein